ncbi:MAG: hypothetical protein HYT93_00685 [Parcubacteria group bacterium]|nr:hypothetical protein [Parcubacteria group bacterium]
MKEGERNFKPTKAAKTAKVVAAFLATAPASQALEANALDTTTHPRAVYETRVPAEAVNKSYTELLLTKLSDTYDYKSESAFLEKAEKIFTGLAKDEKFTFAKRIAIEFPNTKTGERIAQVLLEHYSSWQSPGRDQEVIKKLAERSPFYFIINANSFSATPNAPDLVRRALSRYAVAVSYYEKYNKVPGAADILLENIRKQGSTHYNEIDVILSSELISEPDKKKIREALPPRPRQLFLTLLSLQHIKQLEVMENIASNLAFETIDDPTLMLIAKYLKKSSTLFGDTEFTQWREQLMRVAFEGFNKKKQEASLAMLHETQIKYGVNPIQLMHRAAHVMQYLFNRNESLDENGIKRASFAIEEERGKNMNKLIPKNAVVLTHNEKKKGVPLFATPEKLNAIKERVAREGGSFVHVSGDESDPETVATKAIIDAPAEMILYIFAHGSPDGIYFRDGGQDLGGGNVVTLNTSRYLSPKKLAEAFASRYRDGVKKPEDDVILSNACYQSDFAEEFAREMAKQGVYIPFFVAPSEQGATTTGHPSTPLGTKIEEHWIKATKRGDLFKQEFAPDPLSHPSIFVPDTSVPLSGSAIRPKRGYTPAMMQISGISTYHGVAIG